MEIIHKALKESRDAQDFLQRVDRSMRSKNYNILKTVKPKKRNNELLRMIMQIKEEDEDLRTIIEDYWTKKAEINEVRRFSQEQGSFSTTKESL